MKIHFSIQNGIKWAFFVDFPGGVLSIYKPNKSGSSKHREYRLNGFKIIKRINPNRGTWYNA